MTIPTKDKNLLFGVFPPETAPGEPPLTGVSAQLSFPPIPSIKEQTHINKFHQMIAALYPGLSLAPAEGGASPLPFDDPFAALPGAIQSLWRFTDASLTWRFSLAPDHFAIETRGYAGQAAFVAHAAPMIGALLTYFKPEKIRALSLRGLIRLAHVDVGEISALVRPEVLGLSTCDLGNSLQYSLIKARIKNPNTDDLISVRSGIIMQEPVRKPTECQMADKKEFIVDINIEKIYTLPQINVSASLRDQLEYLHSAFYWLMSDRFMQKHGVEAMAITDQLQISQPSKHKIQDFNFKKPQKTAVPPDCKDKTRHICRLSDSDVSNIGELFERIALEFQRLQDKFNNTNNDSDDIFAKLDIIINETPSSGSSLRDTLVQGHIDEVFRIIDWTLDPKDAQNISDDVYEVRNLSNLSWGDIARLFRTSLVTLRNWLNGAEAEWPKALWVHGVRDELRKLEYHPPERIRIALTTISSGKSPLDLFAEARFNDAISALNNAIQEAVSTEEAERDKHRDTPPKFLQFLGALTDRPIIDESKIIPDTE